MDEIEKDFHDMNKRELKNNVAEYINKIIEPVRIHFQQPHLKDLLEKVSSYRVTK